jgi:hypothetical protein
MQILTIPPDIITSQMQLTKVKVCAMGGRQPLESGRVILAAGWTVGFTWAKQKE